jgi:hypothetical protein
LSPSRAALHLSRAAILVSRGMKVLRAAPAGELGRWAEQGTDPVRDARFKQIEHQQDHRLLGLGPVARYGWAKRAPPASQHMLPLATLMMQRRRPQRAPLVRP